MGADRRAICRPRWPNPFAADRPARIRSLRADAVLARTTAKAAGSDFRAQLLELAQEIDRHIRALQGGPKKRRRISPGGRVS